MVDFLLGLFLCLSVCLSISPSFILVHFGQQLHYADKRVVNIMKVYIERNNLQVDLIQCREKGLLYSRILLRSDGFNAMSLTEHKPLQLRF